MGGGSSGKTALKLSSLMEASNSASVGMRLLAACAALR